MQKSDEDPLYTPYINQTKVPDLCVDSFFNHLREKYPESIDDIDQHPFEHNEFVEKIRERYNISSVPRENQSTVYSIKSDKTGLFEYAFSYYKDPTMEEAILTFYIPDVASVLDSLNLITEIMGSNHFSIDRDRTMVPPFTRHLLSLTPGRDKIVIAYEFLVDTSTGKMVERASEDYVTSRIVPTSNISYQLGDKKSEKEFMRDHTEMLKTVVKINSKTRFFRVSSKEPPLKISMNLFVDYMQILVNYLVAKDLKRFGHGILRSGYYSPLERQPNNLHPQHLISTELLNGRYVKATPVKHNWSVDTADTKKSIYAQYYYLDEEDEWELEHIDKTGTPTPEFDHRLAATKHPTEIYCHITSPIHRFPDLLNQIVTHPNYDNISNPECHIFLFAEAACSMETVAKYNEHLKQLLFEKRCKINHEK